MCASWCKMYILYKSKAGKVGSAAFVLKKLSFNILHLISLLWFQFNILAETMQTGASFYSFSYILGYPPLV